MKKAIYSPKGLFPTVWRPPPVEVEFLGMHESGMAVVRVPFAEKSIGAMLAKRAGNEHPEPLERLVPLDDLEIIEAEA